jgi:hypothetical protein
MWAMVLVRCGYPGDRLDQIVEDSYVDGEY